MSEAAKKAAFYREQAENFSKLASMYDHVAEGGRAIPTEEDAPEKTATAEQQVAQDRPPTLEEVERRVRREYEAFYSRLDPKVPKHEAASEPAFPPAPVKGGPQYPKSSSERQDGGVDLAAFATDVYRQGFVRGFMRGKLGGEISRFYEEQMDEGFTWGKSGRVVLDKVDLAGRGALDEASDMPLDHVDMDAPALHDIGPKVPTRDEKYYSGPSKAPKKIGSMKDLVRHLRDSEEEFVKEAEARTEKARPKVADDIEAEESLIDEALGKRE